MAQNGRRIPKVETRQEAAYYLKDAVRAAAEYLTAVYGALDTMPDEDALSMVTAEAIIFRVGTHINAFAADLDTLGAAFQKVAATAQGAASSKTAPDADAADADPTAVLRR